MKITIDKEFESRPDLDAFISSRFGTNQEDNIKHEVEISEEEAEKLSLSEDVKIYGVRVKVLKANKK